jgi:hypothetical protein
MSPSVVMSATKAAPVKSMPSEDDDEDEEVSVQGTRKRKRTPALFVEPKRKLRAWSSSDHEASDTVPVVQPPVLAAKSPSVKVPAPALGPFAASPARVLPQQQ